MRNRKAGRAGSEGWNGRLEEWDAFEAMEGPRHYKPEEDWRVMAVNPSLILMLGYGALMAAQSGRY